MPATTLGCAQPSPLLLITFAAAGTTSGKGGGNLTSLPLLKSLLLKYTGITAALWPVVFAEDSHNQGSSFLRSITVSRSVSLPRSSGFLSLFYDCGFMFGYIRRPALAPVYPVNRIGLRQ